MSAGETFLLIGAVVAILVLWFVVAVWVGSLVGRALRDRREELEERERRLKFPPGAP